MRFQEGSSNQTGDQVFPMVTNNLWFENMDDGSQGLLKEDDECEVVMDDSATTKGIQQVCRQMELVYQEPSVELVGSIPMGNYGACTGIVRSIWIISKCTWFLGGHQ